MAIDIKELVKSPQYSGYGDSEKAVYSYKISGTDKESDVKTAINGAIPTIAGFVVDDISYSPEWVDTVTEDGLWFADVTYVTTEYKASYKANVPTPPMTIDDEKIAFTIGGERVNIKTPLQTKQTFKNENSYTWPDVDTASIPIYEGINVEGTGENIQVLGADVFKPVGTVSYTKGYAASSVTAAKYKSWFDATGKVNSAAYTIPKIGGSFASGELLYLGVSGGDRDAIEGEDEDVFVLTHTFAYMPNAVVPELDGAYWKTNTGSDASSFVKDGWDFIWFKFVQAQNEDAVLEDGLAPPKYAYVERVFERISFAGLV